MLAKALEGAGLFIEHLQALQLSLTNDPLNAETRYVVAPAVARFDGFGSEWKNYHSRWSDPGYLSSNAPKNIPVPLYDNQLHQLRASHLLIVAEMGVGDEVMYLSGIRGLIDAGSTVSVSCDPRLAPALQRTFPEAEWISRQHFERLDLIWTVQKLIS